MFFGMTQTTHPGSHWPVPTEQHRPVETSGSRIYTLHRRNQISEDQYRVGATPNRSIDALLYHLRGLGGWRSGAAVQELGVLVLELPRQDAAASKQQWCT